MATKLSPEEAKEKAREKRVAEKRKRHDENVARFRAEQAEERFHIRALNDERLGPEVSWERGKRPPVEYSPAVAELILARVANSTASLRRICAGHGLPCHVTINNWRQNKPEFAAAYDLAKAMQADLLAEEALEISDTQEPGETIKLTPNGLEITRTDRVDHRKLQVGTRQWLAGKLNRQRYGDKTALVGGGKDDPPIQFEVDGMTDAQLGAIAAAGAPPKPAEPG